MDSFAIYLNLKSIWCHLDYKLNARYAVFTVNLGLTFILKDNWTNDWQYISSSEGKAISCWHWSILGGLLSGMASDLVLRYLMIPLDVLVLIPLQWESLMICICIRIWINYGVSICIVGYRSNFFNGLYVLHSELMVQVNAHVSCGSVACEPFGVQSLTWLDTLQNWMA